jgi:hypothetical protein
MQARTQHNTIRNTTSSLIASGLIILLTLIACTGSFEDGNSSARLVFAITTPGTINCLTGNTSTSIAVPVGLLITGSNLEQNGQLTNCSTIATEGAPYDLITTPTGDLIIVSLPSQSSIELRTNKTSDTVVKLQTKADTGPFCPTRLALSPDSRRLAVLDDPSAPKEPSNPSNNQTVCTNTSNRSPRVIVFDITATPTSGVLEPIGVATSGIGGTFRSDRTRGPFGLSMLNLASDAQAFVIGPFVNTYEAFRLNKDNDAQVTGTSLSITNLRTLDNSLRLDLTNVGSRLLLTFSNTSNSTGSAYFLDPNTLAPEQVKLNDTALGATNRAVWNKRPNDSLIAYLQPNSVIFQRLSSPVSNSKPLSVSSPIDAAFTSDGYAWVLQQGGLVRFDITNLTTINNSSSASFGLNARAIGTFIQQ